MTQTRSTQTHSAQPRNTQIPGTTARRTVTIEYSGQTSGSGPLALGQDNMIRCIRFDDPAHINKHAVWPVPANIDVASALEAFRVLVERHESLRTVFTGPPGEQPTKQTVRAEGEFTVDIVDTDQDPEAFAWEVGRTRLAERFDLTVDFGLRLALVTVDGRLSRVSLVVCHSAADAASTGLLFQEWAQVASGGELAPLTAPTPRDIAEQERSASGVRRAKASLRHWERVLRSSPHAVFADSELTVSPGQLPTYMVHSVSAAEACQAAALRTGGSPSAVMFAAYAAVIALRAAQQTVVVAALSANRHRTGLDQFVGTLAQDALIALDTDAGDFDELVKRAAAASMAGFWHSTFESQKIWQLIEDVGYLRGARYARHVVLNDLSVTIPDDITRDRPIPARDPQQTWLPEQGIPTRLMLNVWRLTGCVEITVHADPRLFSKAETEQLVAGMLTLIKAAAVGPVPLADLPALTGIAPGRRDGEWERVGSSWIDLDAVRDVLAIALDKRPALVAVEDGRLVARIAEDGRPLTPEAAHRAIMDSLLGGRRGKPATESRVRGGDEAEGEAQDEPERGDPVVVSTALCGWETAMAPQEYAIYAGTPLAADDRGAWESLTLSARGDGRAGATDWQAILA